MPIAESKPYDLKRFNEKFNMVTALAQQLVRIDYDQMHAWLTKLMAGEAETDPEIASAMEALLAITAGFAQLKDVLTEHGIPVRRIEPGQEPEPPKNAVG